MKNLYVANHNDMPDDPEEIRYIVCAVHRLKNGGVQMVPSALMTDAKAAQVLRGQYRVSEHPKYECVEVWKLTRNDVTLIPEPDGVRQE